MKVLLVGGGGREHAIGWKLKRDDPSIELIASPGNPGLAEIARCEAVGGPGIRGLVSLAERERVHLVVVGPEVPLEAGLVDQLAARRIPAFGPTRAAAEIETSKRFAKELMLRAGVPTAGASFHSSTESARRAARVLGAPVVIKASGLAAGKGVVVCQSLEEADSAIEAMLRHGAFGEAGAEILVEEHMEGEELSIFAMTDGRHVLPMLPIQDHKRLLAGDRGPNTGGMGAYAPVSLGSAALVDEAVERIFIPTLRALDEAGRPFRGLLYAGLMLGTEGPRVVEFNCRFGDPETEAILPLMRDDLLGLLLAIASGESLADHPALEWDPGHAVTTVVATREYPGSASPGAPIFLPEQPEGVLVFHAGTSRTEDGVLRTAGGRVFAVTGLAGTLEEAQRLSAEHARAIRFEGSQSRDDIGWRELARARAS